jgi:hypothetical protein
VLGGGAQFERDAAERKKAYEALSAQGYRSTVPPPGVQPPASTAQDADTPLELRRVRHTP